MGPGLVAEEMLLTMRSDETNDPGNSLDSFPFLDLSPPLDLPYIVMPDSYGLYSYGLYSYGL